jgi:hypothetical protein
VERIRFAPLAGKELILHETMAMFQLFHMFHFNRFQVRRCKTRFERARAASSSFSAYLELIASVESGQAEQCISNL